MLKKNGQSRTVVCSITSHFYFHQALVEAQTRLRQQVDGFHFMLGFSGWYYQHGNEEENEGDRMLLGNFDQVFCG